MTASWGYHANAELEETMIYQAILLDVNDEVTATSVARDKPDLLSEGSS